MYSSVIHHHLHIVLCASFFLSKPWKFVTFKDLVHFIQVTDVLMHVYLCYFLIIFLVSVEPVMMFPL